MLWRFREINEKRAEQLADELRQPLKVGEFLAARGFQNSGEVKAFIRADLKNLPAPMTLSDMDKAVERLLKARRQAETVAVCGDYDADGLTASALLAKGLRELGHEVFTRIPNRLTDGYGLKPEAVAELAERGATLLVTVDNGIADVEAAEKAAALGLDLIITDHHQLPPELPAAVAIIDPHRDEIWRKAPPAGVGVAFLLLAALKTRYREEGLLEEGQGPALMDFLPLVAIGTIADLAPLLGPNRIMVRHGLMFLGSSSHPGLAALKKVCRISGESVSPRDVGFRLAPRLNAAGRLGSAEPALELLLAEEAGEAVKLAGKLEELNRQRHQNQNKLCEEALERMETEIPSGRRTVVLAGENWPRGLLGLAASRVAEATQKPTVLLSLENGLAIGSGRTAGSFNLYKALETARHLYISFGGHSQAAGLSLETGLVEDFKHLFEEAASQEDEKSGQPEVLVDIEASLSDLDFLVKPLAALEPYGQANPAPVVALKRVKVVDARPTDTGGDQHMKLILGDGLRRLTAVGFNLAPRLCEVGREMDVALSLEFSEYKGQLNSSWRLVDFRPPDDV